MKGIVSDAVGYADSDRRKRAWKYAKLCKLLTDEGMTVICCTVAMYEEVRRWNRENNRGYVEIFLDVPMEVLIGRNQKGMYSAQKAGALQNLAGVDLAVELPKKPDIVIRNNGELSISECVDRIVEWKIRWRSDFDRDTEYWNRYYDSKPNITAPSLFAHYICDEVLKEYRAKNESEKCAVLELGCGNGRDSTYFAQNNCDVTAIDASEKAIRDNEKIGGYSLCA